MQIELLGRRGPGVYVAPGSGGGTGDGGFVDQPVVTTTASGNTTINGKVKPGSFGKFVVPLATIAAGRQYTFRYTPQFAQLAQQGKLAMVGFGFKNNNDFHIVGLRGDGSTGLHKYQVYGTPPNGWNVQTGQTTNDGGTAASGTQAGPNYLRLITSADGATYTLKSSTDGTTWHTEFTGQALTPFSNVSGVTTFGVALWFNNADAGPFSITIDQFADVAVPPPIGSFVTTPAAQTNNSATYTFSSVNVGAADPNRITVVVVHWELSTTDRAPTNMTLGGVNMTLVQSSHAASLHGVAIYQIANPTGTTATIACAGSSDSGVFLGMQISVYRLVPASATAVDSGNNSGTSPVTVTDIEVKSGGFLICAGIGNSISTQSPTYNGIDTPVTDLVNTLETTAVRCISWSVSTTEDVTTNDPGVQGPTNNRAVAASWL